MVSSCSTSSQSVEAKSSPAVKTVSPYLFWRFLLPFRIQGLNEVIQQSRASAMAAAATRKLQLGKVALLARQDGLCRLDDGASFTFVHVEPNRKRDPDNFCGAAQKLILDGLQKAGVLPNDGWTHVHSIQHFWRLNEGAVIGVWVMASSAPLSKGEAYAIVDC